MAWTRQITIKEMCMRGIKCKCGGKIHVGGRCKECFDADPPITTAQRIAELEAKLAMVSEWAVRWLGEHDPIGDFEVELDSILSGQTSVLAAVKDCVKRCGGDNTRTEYKLYFDLPVPCEDSEKYLNIKAIVLGKEEK